MHRGSTNSSRTLSMQHGNYRPACAMDALQAVLRRGRAMWHVSANGDWLLGKVRRQVQRRA